MKNKINKWVEDPPYNWGKIYRIKDEYRKNFSGEDGLEYLQDDYWFIGNTSFDKRGLENIKKLQKGQDKNFGIKYWEFRKNDYSKEHKLKPETVFEYNFILEGKIRGRVGTTKDIILRAGDFIVINPNFDINLQEEIIQDTKGLTIKIPLKIPKKIKKIIN